jgi:2,5-dioxopentanoate dehydrogenase
MPPGVFGLLQGTGHELGRALVTHPLTAAVGFTGSLAAGRALFDAAAARDEPIPVYAEMGSVNPVFVLPGAAAERADAIAAGLVGSVTLGIGQFCTNPGLVFAVEDEASWRLARHAARLIEDVEPGTMLYPGICSRYEEGVERLAGTTGVEPLGRSRTPADAERGEAAALAFTVAGETFERIAALAEEVFGPATLFVRAESRQSLLALARRLQGQLTATLHATDRDLAEHDDLVRVLERKVGRLIVNGFPTGVEVSPAMQHGGPYPATTDPRTTSVGTAAIERFARPICYQAFPQGALPADLRDENPRGVWRLVDSEWTRDPVAAA